MLEPAIKQPAQKFAVLFRRNRKIRNLTRCRINFHAGDKLYKLHAQLDKKIKHLVRMVRIPGVQQGQGVILDIVLPAVFYGPHYPVKRPGTRMVGAVVIVKFFGPVDTDPDKELVFVQKPAPVFVEQNRIGLQRVADFLAGDAVFFCSSTTLL